MTMRVLLLRTASDGPLLGILESIRSQFPEAHVTLLTAADQPRAHLPVDRALVHWGGKIALVRLVRQEGYQIVAVPWTGEPIQPRWKLLLPFLCRRHHIVIFNEGGHFFPLSRHRLRALWEHLRRRWKKPVPALRFAPRPGLGRFVWGSLALARLAVRLPGLWLGALLRENGKHTHHTGGRR